MVESTVAFGIIRGKNCCKDLACCRDSRDQKGSLTRIKYFINVTISVVVVVTRCCASVAKQQSRRLALSVNVADSNSKYSLRLSLV